MFLLEGSPAPDHATFARFRSIHFAPCSKRILAEMSDTLFDMGEISGETIFIDGTKIERLSFVRCIITKRRVRAFRVVTVYVLEATKAYILLVCLC